MAGVSRCGFYSVSVPFNHSGMEAEGGAAILNPWLPVALYSWPSQWAEHGKEP
jgi:hypothetical protein